jgi:hypothetical protein
MKEMSQWRFDEMTNLLKPFDVDCRLKLASHLSLLVEIVGDLVCSELVGGNEQFHGIVSRKTRSHVDVSLGVN